MAEPRRRGAVLIASCAVLLGMWPAAAAQASFPGRNGRIAFAHTTGRGVNISSMWPDGSGRRILAHRWISRDPAWSGSGSSIAFSASDRGLPNELCVMDAEGHGRTCVTDDDRTQVWPAWSPDGRRIAYVVEGRQREYEIATMRSDGTGRRVLTRHSGGSSDPDWSPDGTRIAFDVGGQIATMRPAGADVRFVTTEGGYEPTWSPDGRWIAFQDAGDLYTIHPDGTGLTRLTETGIEDSSPAWSPGGDRIVFLRSRSNDERGMYMAAIWTMGADGSRPARVLRRVSYDQLPLESPAWQPVTG